MDLTGFDISVVFQLIRSVSGTIVRLSESVHRDISRLFFHVPMLCASVASPAYSLLERSPLHTELTFRNFVLERSKNNLERHRSAS